MLPRTTQSRRHTGTDDRSVVTNQVTDSKNTTAQSTRLNNWEKPCRRFVRIKTIELTTA